MACVGKPIPPRSCPARREEDELHYKMCVIEQQVMIQNISACGNTLDQPQTSVLSTSVNRDDDDGFFGAGHEYFESGGQVQSIGTRNPFLTFPGGGLWLVSGPGVSLPSTFDIIGGRNAIIDPDTGGVNGARQNPTLGGTQFSPTVRGM